MSDDRSQPAVPDEGAASPRLQVVLATHQATRRAIDSPTGSAWACLCGEPHSAAHIAAAWREACTIRTVQELESLPFEVVVRDASGEVWAHSDTRLGLLYGFWIQPGEEVPSNGTMVALPALLLWHPDWDAS